MESHVAAPVGFEQFYASLFKKFGRGNYVRRLRVAAERDDWRVFKQEQHVADFFLLAKINQFLLQAQAGRVVYRAELEDGNQTKV